MKNITYISVELTDKSRPKERPPKSNWKLEIIRKAMMALQHASPRKVAEVVWHYFTMPGKVFFSESQLKIIEQAELGFIIYQGDRIATYKWGNSERRVLLCHGWRSKAADFRGLIEQYLSLGFEVHALDCRAHGKSEGKHTALPEYRDILKSYIADHGRFDIILGYSLGGIAAGVVMSEIDESLRPEKLFLVAAPSYVRFFFKGVINDLGLKHSVYEKMADMVGEVYGDSIDHFDLRMKTDVLNNTEVRMIYCEDDEMVAFDKGMELFEMLDDAHFVQARGFGHYKIISHPMILQYVIEHSESQVEELALA